MSSSPVISGHCACGKVSWTSTSAPERLEFCYCRTCQQTSGAPFAPWIEVAKSALTWSGGDISSWRPKIGDRDISVSTRSFCASCGSCLSIQYDLDFYAETTHLAAGTVTKGAENVPQVSMHLWLKRAPRWYPVSSDDGVARFEDIPKEFEQVIDEHQKKQA